MSCSCVYFLMRTSAYPITLRAHHSCNCLTSAKHVDYYPLFMRTVHYQVDKYQNIGKNWLKPAQKVIFFLEDYQREYHDTSNMKFLVQKILVNCSLKLRTNTLSSVLERNGRMAVFSNLDVESLPPAAKVECILHSIRVINYRRRRYLIKLNLLS